MKGGARIAVGVGIGYLLGRTRKMRWALGLAGAAMSKRSTGVAGELLERGTSALGTPELTKITETVRGELLGAVRSAAVTAASNRVDALNERLQLAAVPEELGRGRGRKADEEEDEAAPPASAESETADEDLDELPDEEDAEEPAPRPRARRAGTGKTSRTGSRTSAGSSGSAETPSTATRRRRPRAEADEAPVRRTRR